MARSKRAFGSSTFSKTPAPLSVKQFKQKGVGAYSMTRIGNTTISSGRGKIRTSTGSAGFRVNSRGRVTHRSRFG